jgi:hypothetical protein
MDADGRRVGRTTMPTEPDLKGVLWPERLPRSATYDPARIRENQMVPNPLGLTEWLCEALGLGTGNRFA